jgi:fumarylacetoacetate (FAA) hydrolase
VIIGSLKNGTLCVKEGESFFETDTTALHFLKSGNFNIVKPAVNPEWGPPIPESFCFLDGSAFLNHVELARRARGAEIPKDLYTIPLMYQGISAPLLGPNDPVKLRNFEWGLDFEAEIGVVTDFVPEGVTPSDALNHVKFFTMFNDWTYRNLLPREAETGFGFIQSKPASSFAPFLVAPDKLPIKDGKLFTTIKVYRSGELYGELDTGEMFFCFGTLISHAAKTRSLPAGSIIGSGTISNKEGNGYGCIAEKRAVEMIKQKDNLTPFLDVGEEVVIESDVFGEIRARVI